MNCVRCLRGEEHPWHDDGTWNSSEVTGSVLYDGVAHTGGSLSNVEEDQDRYAVLSPKGRR